MFPKSRRLNSPKIFARNKVEAEHPELWDGLVGAWSPCLQTHKNDRVYDWSGKANHGVLTNMDPATDWVLSQGRPALDFDGTNDYVEVAHSSIFAWPTNGTFATWCVPRTLATLRQLWMKWQNPPLVYQGVLCHSDKKVEWQPHVGKSTGTLTVGALNHIVVSYGRGGAHVYLNGIKDAVSTSTAITPVAEANVPYQIGADTANSRYWDGQILDHCYWNRQLTAGDVAVLYRLGPGGWAERRNTSYFFITPPKVKSLYTPVRTSLGKNFIFRT